VTGYRRTNWVWGVLALLMAGYTLAYALGVVPAGVVDLATRAAPGLLVAAGLALLLQGRIRASGLIALAISAAIVGGIGAYAFSSRAGEQRSDTVQPFTQSIGNETRLLRVRIQTRATDLDLTASLTATNEARGTFTGSLDNRVDVAYEAAADGSATLSITETTASPVPTLQTVGRGTLVLELPTGVPIDIEYGSGGGSTVLNLDGLSLERLNVALPTGDVVVSLPSYSPTLSSPADLLGTIAASSGNLTVVVPDDVAARFELERGGSGIEPQYDAAVYNYLIGDVLEARAIETAAIRMRFVLEVPRGLVRVQSSG
jgi:hypothetical protein